MSVYISGVEMPKEHPLYITLRPDGSVHVWDSYSGVGYGTQAVPVPEHGDLKDFDTMEVLSWNAEDEGDFEDGVLFVLDKMEELPVIIPGDRAKEETE